MKKFKKVYIEITNLCNLSCDFCPKTVRKPEYMSSHLFEQILHQIEGKTDRIYLHVMGEPLLHPQLGEFLDRAHIHGMRVDITTNGTLIRQQGLMLLQKPALKQVNVSLHSFEAQRGGTDAGQYLQDILDFTLQASQQAAMTIVLRFWTTRDEHEQGMQRSMLDKIQETFQLPERLEIQLTPLNGQKIAPKVYINQASQFVWPIEARGTSQMKAFCYGLREQIAILVDGTVVPCCLDSEGVLGLGNITETALEEILSGARARSIYEGFSQGRAEEALCKQCEYRRKFVRTDGKTSAK